jgi:hypothetical protein
MKPAATTHVDHNYQGRALLLLVAVVLMVVGGLMWEIANSPWMPWIVGSIAVTIIVVFAGVPVTAVVAGTAAMAHPKGRKIVMTVVKEHAERRHQLRLAAAAPPPQQLHLHPPPGAEYPVEGGRYRADS